MTTHPSIAAGQSQCEIILHLLISAAGQEVSLSTLHRHTGSLAVHSRIHDLRTRGHTIHHRSERHGRKIHSYYRIPQ